MDNAWGVWLVLIGATAANEIWRIAGVWLSRGVDPNGPLMLWVKDVLDRARGGAGRAPSSSGADGRAEGRQRLGQPSGFRRRRRRLLRKPPQPSHWARVSRSGIFPVALGAASVGGGGAWRRPRRFVIPAIDTHRHPGQAKREPGSQNNERHDLLRSRIRLRPSGTRRRPSVGFIGKRFRRKFARRKRPDGILSRQHREAGAGFLLSKAVRVDQRLQLDGFLEVDDGESGQPLLLVNLSPAPKRVDAVDIGPERRIEIFERGVGLAEREKDVAPPVEVAPIVRLQRNGLVRVRLRFLDLLCLKQKPGSRVMSRRIVGIDA